MGTGCAARLRSVVERAASRLAAISDADSARAPAPGKWSPRELVGHLVDSASNNHQRFVRARFREDLEFPGYDQDEWVEAQAYQEASWEDLVALWRTFNLHIAHVMDHTPEAVRLREVRRHNLDEIGWQTVPKSEPTTLDAFMADYVGHLEHHLRTLLGPLPESTE